MSLINKFFANKILTNEEILEKLSKYVKANGSLKINFRLRNGVSTKRKSSWDNENLYKNPKEILRINVRLLEW